MLELQPTSSERKLVARALMHQGLLIGSVDEIWTHPSAYRALSTWRMCIDAIQKLHDTKNAIYPSWIKAIIMGEVGPTAPFGLDDIAEFISEDSAACEYWRSLISDKDFPVKCPLCKTSAAYVGFNEVICRGGCNVA